MQHKPMEKPLNRSKLRLQLGTWYYTFKRKQLWFKQRHVISTHLEKQQLPFVYFKHQSILMRKLKDVDMWYQTNKVINLKIAIKTLNGLVLKPGQIMSYWRMIGKPTKSKGYVNGMVLSNGGFKPGMGGGLCQLSNLIFWMTIHTPLSVIERHRHGYDVFPDSNRTQPFGSGATCFYPYGDLMIKNDTNDTYQLTLEVTDKYLVGAWRVSREPMFKYEIEERDHEMKPEYWGGYGRYNNLFQLKYDLEGNLLDERLLIQNAAIMMYSPFIDTEKKS